MAKLAIVATAEIASGRMDEVLVLLIAHGNRCLQEEPGTEQYEILKPRNAIGVVLLFAVYQDDASFKAHWNGPLVARMRVETKGVLTKLTGTWCDLIKGPARKRRSRNQTRI